MSAAAVRASETKVHRVSPWRLIAFEVAAAAVCALLVGVVTTALDFGARMPSAVGPGGGGRLIAEISVMVLLGIFLLVAVRLQQVVGALHSAVWKREH